MNNSKVRIYELSRELNLDNKDILAVCERLNIAVKSHSSTITESDAERIRKNAEKYLTSSGAAKTALSEKSTGVAHESGLPHSDRKKQEILEIRPPKVNNGPRSQGTVSEDKPTPPLMATPPKFPTSQSGVATLESTVNVPSSRADSDEVVAPELSASAENQSFTLHQPSVTPISSQQPTQDYQRTLEDSSDMTQSQLSPAPTMNVSEKRGNPQNGPQLVSPPVRPAAGGPKGQPQNIDRPVKRPKKKGESGPDSEGSVTVSSTPQQNGKKKEIKVGERQEASPTPQREPAEDGKKLSAPVIKSKSPVPPAKKTAVKSALKPKPQMIEEDEDEEVVAVEDEDVVVEIDKPKRNPLQLRPTHPKTAKRTPTWEVDEEDDTVAKAKAAKGKAKRARPKPLIDDDDEDLDDALNLSEPAVASLSLMRPSKPKSATTATKASQKPTSSKARKPERGGGQTREQKTQVAEAAKKPERPETLVLTGTMTVQELAESLCVPETEIIKRLFSQGIKVNITETLDLNSIKLIAEELGVTLETAEKRAMARKVTEMLDEADLEYLQRRPPVVTIMGHVDHGKTTLLDSIRETKVAQGEAGGITQHIGAYHVDVEHEGEMEQIVFLDTPGHEAFTAMRARGARVTDIAVLVVAADDGVRPQTIEAISHAKAAKVPLVVAINKIDKEAANPDRVKQELAEHGLVSEEWGGDTIMVPVSAIKGENLDTLLEMILLVAEIEDLRANPDRPAKGTVIEANLDRARGPVATLLVQNGTLKVGDIVVAGSALGKVRAMIDDRFQRVEEASPSFAVEVLGLREVPQAGDEFDVFEQEKEAAAIADQRREQQRQSRLLQGRISLSQFSQQAKEGELKELNLIIKADVQGSVEAIVGALRQLPQKEVQLKLLLAAPGEITETDIDLAAASGAVLIGFNTTLASGARQAADQAGVDVREYNIIYKLLDDIQGAMEGLLEPELVEESLGETEVRAVFPVGKGTVAGCYVLSGKVIRNCRVRVRRGNQVIHEGVLDSLKRMKDDTKEVNAGYECGIRLDSFSDWVEGDIIETYRMATKRRTLTV